MTPKEKAQELFGKYAMYLRANLRYDEEANEDAKVCALIAVEFAREQFYKYCAAEMGTDGTYDDHFDRLKQEIEAL